MKKNKIKLSLIDDYINIILIKNLLKNNFSNLNADCVNTTKNTQSMVEILENIYDSLFEKLNMNDLSLDILKKELQTNNSLFLNTKNNNFLNLNDDLSKCNLTLNSILNNLKQKISNLKIDVRIEYFANI